MPALRDGAYVAVNRNDSDVLSYLRKNPRTGESVMVVLNMSSQAKKLAFDLKPYGINDESAKPLLRYPGNDATTMPIKEVDLPPFGTLVASVK
jgi:hypothetical protein